MLLASIGVEKLTTTATATVSSGAEAGSAEEQAALRDAFVRRGLDAWTLFDFYDLPRRTASIGAYVRLAGMLGNPTLVLEALRFADGASIRLSLDCYYWVLYASRVVPDFGEVVLDVFAQLQPRGLSPDYLLFTLAFMYCAVQKDGELALALYQQHFARRDINPTPELVLLYLQACAACEAPTMEMVVCGDALIDHLESVGSSKDNVMEVFDQYVELAAHVGAVGSGFSKLKKLVSYGKPLSTRLLNSLLLANSNAAAPSGSVAMTEELMQLFRVLRVPANDDTLECLGYCEDAHGTTEELTEWRTELEERLTQQPDGTLGRDEDPAVLQDPPHRLRTLRVAWNLRPRDTILKRFGQTTKLRPPEHVSSTPGSIIPFGRSPGEKRV